MALTDGLVHARQLSDANDSVGSANLTTSGVTFSAGKDGDCAVYATNGYARKTSFTMPMEYTLSMRCYLSDTSNTQYLFKNDGGAPSIYVRFDSGDNTNLFIYHYGSGGSKLAHIPRADIPTNTWFNLILTNVNNGVLKSYLNGTLKATSSTQTDGTSSAINMNIGGYNTDAGVNPHGKIDATYIWNRVLSSDEITSLQTSFYPFLSAFTPKIIMF